MWIKRPICLHLEHVPLCTRRTNYRLTGQESEVTCVEWSKYGWKLATCADDMMYRIWKIQPKDCLEQQFIHGQAERMESVQYPSKDSIVVTNFYEPKENQDDSLQTSSSKKRRIRSPSSSPLKALSTLTNLNSSPPSKA